MKPQGKSSKDLSTPTNFEGKTQGQTIPNPIPFPLPELQYLNFSRKPNVVCNNTQLSVVTFLGLKDFIRSSRI